MAFHHDEKSSSPAYQSGSNPLPLILDQNPTRLSHEDVVDVIRPHGAAHSQPSETFRTDSAKTSGSDKHYPMDPEKSAAKYEVDAESQSDHIGSINGGQNNGLGTENEKTRYDIWWLERKFLTFYREFRWIFHIIYFCVWTAWFVHGVITHRDTPGLGWLKIMLFYIGVCVWFITYYIPVAVFMRPVRFLWANSVSRVYNMIPGKLRQPLAALVTFAVFLIGSFVPEETGDNSRANRAVSIFGLLVMIFVLTVTSRDYRKIQWHTVIGGMLTQFIIAVFVLRTHVGYDIFSFVSEMARTLLGFANEGVVFLTDDTVPKLPWFFTGVVPPIIFFVALVQLLYHLGFLQWFVGKFAVFFFWTLKVSGAEALVAAATPFIGQGESAMLIKGFVPHLTLAELHQVMTCGFATIAGSVLVAYIGLGLNPQALVSSCIMSIPASLAVSKMRYPETEETLTSGKVVIPEEQDNKAVNSIHAFANGAWLGIKIAGMIVATLLCIIALVGLVNGFLGWWGKYWGLEGIDPITGAGKPILTLQLILGYLLYPVAWLLGVPKKDLLPVGELIGSKVIINEFYAFIKLSTDERYLAMSPRSRLIALYACCGFGNIGSLGTQIGVLSQIAPGRAGDVSRVALSALFSGVLATLTSASVAGMLYTDGMAF
ncbi:Na+ dependent nucleoside transporter C-terminus-domain-containing protein [Podospora appendiculata]|uniref:Na+ dependent nucleoside transporter C-terminus-domain-containing protein n=1 Tax=Podospora appendiculata TaxID=314037 RepID=A0AAE0XAL9_9PEZI|nr:Na+ dependent nucleoside transporter C-terminus-domain-containing protein [Podospora appendiculata]